MSERDSVPLPQTVPYADVRSDLKSALANGGVGKRLGRRVQETLSGAAAEIVRLRERVAWLEDHASRTKASLEQQVKAPPAREKLPRTRSGRTHHFTIRDADGDVDVYVTPNTYADGRLGEVFIVVGKQGEITHAAFEALGTVLSISLQHGVPLREFTRKLRGTQFRPSGLTGDPDYPIAKSVLDVVAAYLDKNFGGGE